LISGTAFVGAAVAGMIVFLGGEDVNTGFIAGTIGFAAGWGLGAGIARKSWLAMIIGVLVGQLAGLVGGQVMVMVGIFVGDCRFGGFFWTVFPGAAISLLPLAAVMELVDRHLARRAEAAGAAGADSVPPSPPEAAGAPGTALDAPSDVASGTSPEENNSAEDDDSPTPGGEA